MSVSGISSSSFFNAQSANVQNQQQWQQEFQKLAQELQAGSSSPQATAQTTAQTELAALQPGSQTSATPALIALRARRASLLHKVLRSTGYTPTICAWTPATIAIRTLSS